MHPSVCFTETFPSKGGKRTTARVSPTNIPNNRQSGRMISAPTLILRFPFHHRRERSPRRSDKNRSGGRCFMKTAVGLNDGGRKSKPPIFWWSLLSPYVRGQRLREQTAGVRKRFFGGYRRFFAPSKKWGYINKTNNRIYLHPSVCFADTFPRRRRQTPLPSASPLTGESP